MHRKMRAVKKGTKTPKQKHFIDAYDPITKSGIKFQYTDISPQDIINQEKGNTKLDWIFDTTNQHCCIWDEIAFCEIPSNNWEEAISVCKNNVILDTGRKEWILLQDKRSFCIETEGKKMRVWIGKSVTLDEVIEITCLKNTLDPAGKKTLQKTFQQANYMDEVPIIYARCENSMNFLDPKIRQYALDIEYEKGMVYAIKAVAGSGKTTTLLKLASVNSNKKILYLAFNKAIVKEIRSKSPKNLIPYTFDAFIRSIYISRHQDFECEIQYLKPYTFGKIYTWFQNKPFKMKQNLIAKYNKFCKDIHYTEMFDFLKNKYPGKKKGQLLRMWQDTKQRKLITFDGLRKLAFVQHWFKDYIDTHYDMVFIDEAQDFDLLMLEMLINDTTIPKVFVGDPRQAIYEWRGAINAFKKLPSDAFIMEFYTTWRIGNPACDKIREEFEDCWMVAGNAHTTTLYHNKTPIGMYVYLFRSWKYLLQTAVKMPNIWINDFTKKKPMIEKLHAAVTTFGMSEEDKAKFEDDLPNFLLKLNAGELSDLLDQIEANLVSKRKATCHMYTIHAYKGMENDQIRIFNDMDHEEELNIYYVALTRGKQNIYLDRGRSATPPPAEKCYGIIKTPPFLTTTTLMSFLKNTATKEDFATILGAVADPERNRTDITILPHEININI
jgi:hypothetical protein